MKVFSVCGVKQSGKTTTIENIIRELCARGYRVGSVKEIHYEAFRIDPSPESNTRRHREAGAGLVTARGYYETDLLFPEKLAMDKLLDFYEDAYDYVVLEGVEDYPVPNIVTAHCEEDLREKLNGFTFCVSGQITNECGVWNVECGVAGVPFIDATTDVKILVDLIEQKVYDRLPNFPAECCSACGMNCTEFAKAVLRGEKDRGVCVADKGVSLTVGGKRIKMVPFVQTVLKNAVLGVAGELDGYVSGAEIQVIIGGKGQ